jgi:D-beta-D-heptose 7-phosphate kinase/D-beta-D-heptose 1-phosphate adenosyltransferase
LASELPIEVAVQLSNVAAGIAIERFGCARITLSELAHRLLEQDVVNKVFDDEHFFALKEALKGRKYALLGVSGASGFTSSIFKAIRGMARSDRDLIVYLCDQKPDEDFVGILASLHEVKFILVDPQSMQRLCQTIPPEEIRETAVLAVY